MAKEKAEKSLVAMLEEALVKKDEQPYEVPGNWVWVKIGSLIEEVEKRDPKKEEVDKFTYLDISSINNITGRITNPKIYKGNKAPSRARQVVKSNDILFSTVRPYLKNIAVVDEIYNDQIASTGFCVLRNDGIIDSNLLFHFVRSDIFVDRLNKFQRGISYPAVKTSDLLKQPIPLLPLPEQKRIVKNLSSMLGKLKEAIELIQEARDTFEERRAAILNKAFTGELTKKWRKENPDVENAFIEINEVERKPYTNNLKTIKAKILDNPYIPKKWLSLQINVFIESLANGIYKPVEYYSDDGIACARMYNIQEGKLVFKNMKRMILTDEEYEKYSLIESDILVNRVNSRELVGKAAYVSGLSEKLVFESKNIRLRLLEKEVMPRYLNHLFLTRIIRDVFEGSAKQTVGMATISQPQISNLTIPLPPLSEQEEIVQILDKLLSHEDEARALIDMEEEIDLLEKSILSKAFRGELGTNDPNDEPAIELLKREI